MKARYLYSELAATVAARLNCEKLTGAEEWFHKHSDRIKELVEEMPSGSGFDSGTEIDLDMSHGDKLVFHTSYHHMNDSGMYDGWTDHTITVTPSFIGGFNLRVSGRNRNDIKEYIGDVFSNALAGEAEVEEAVDAE